MLLTHDGFARGEFAGLTSAFRHAGYRVEQPLAGVLQISAGNARPRQRVLISVGVHGDETAPIEIMADLMLALGQQPDALQVDLMLAIGNIDAIAQARRFIDVDLNRLFTPGRSQFAGSAEAARADQLMEVCRQFFAGHVNGWHLDLHTAIRASRFPAFAIVPGIIRPWFVAWLGAAGIQAAVFNPQASVTFSSFTSTCLGVTSCTAELGRIGVMGKNDLTQFASTARAIDRLLRGDTGPDPLCTGKPPLLFEVAQELVKHSEQFRLAFDDTAENFTCFAPGSLIATDGPSRYVVGDQPEYVLFPNQNVRTGLRAGLLVRQMPNPALQDQNA